MAKEHFERHKQPWNGEEAGQLRILAGKGKGLKEIAKTLNRSEESTKDFAKKNKIEIAKKRKGLRSLRVDRIAESVIFPINRRSGPLGLPRSVGGGSMDTGAPALPLGRIFVGSHPHDHFLVIAILIYIWAGILGGFGPGAVEHLSGAGPVRPARLHLHAVAFFGWLGLLTVQIGLVRSGWIEWHRRLGIAGAFLAAAMIPLGVWASIASVPGRIARDSNPGFVAVPLLDMVVFAVLVTAALRMRGQPAAHRRLFLLATLQLTGAGFGRWLGPVLGPMFAQLGPLGGWIALYGMPMLGVAAIGAWDAATRRRLHPAYVWGAALMLIAQVLAIALMKNDAWIATVVKLAG